jgi:hypothetical protein
MLASAYGLASMLSEERRSEVARLAAWEPEPVVICHCHTPGAVSHYGRSSRSDADDLSIAISTNRIENLYH